MRIGSRSSLALGLRLGSDSCSRSCRCRCCCAKRTGSCFNEPLSPSWYSGRLRWTRCRLYSILDKLRRPQSDDWWRCRCPWSRCWPGGRDGGHRLSSGLHNRHNRRRLGGAGEPGRLCWWHGATTLPPMLAHTESRVDSLLRNSK